MVGTALLICVESNWQTIAVGVHGGVVDPRRVRTTAGAACQGRGVTRGAGGKQGPCSSRREEKKTILKYIVPD